MNQAVRFDAGLIRRYDIAGPRYTSYPTAVQFHEGFDAELYRRYVRASNDELIPVPLSLYVHLPFCRSLCYYCGCMKKITRHDQHGVAYLRNLTREIAMQGELFDRDRQATQLHFGGGTPTFFDDAQLQHIMTTLGQAFQLDHSSNREFSIEVDPRTVDAGRLAWLAELGFNRISLGVQDIDPQVQKAVNRVQDPVATLNMVQAARSSQFNSVSIDLMYGLPLQTPASFRSTLEAVLEARPDRLSVYNYAHLPHIFRAQRLINSADIPSPNAKLELMALCIEMLTQAGYVYIGMDHFALPDDELSLAQRNGGLQRNFQGYSTRAECDLVGLGVSAIGKVGDCYAQNIKDIRQWGSAVAEGNLPVWRGIGITAEDRLRQKVIESIMCQGVIDIPDIEQRFELEFTDHFAIELQQLEQFERDGLVEVTEAGLKVTPPGRLLLRAIAMVFDQHLQAAREQQRFSRVI